nr:MAG TPA: hypothetical protein [Caudoviricetes sp.]
MLRGEAVSADSLSVQENHRAFSYFPQLKA